MMVYVFGKTENDAEALYDMKVPPDEPRIHGPEAGHDCSSGDAHTDPVRVCLLYKKNTLILYLKRTQTH